MRRLLSLVSSGMRSRPEASVRKSEKRKAKKA